MATATRYCANPACTLNDPPPTDHLNSPPPRFGWWAIKCVSIGRHNIWECVTLSVGEAATRFAVSANQVYDHADSTEDDGPSNRSQKWRIEPFRIQNRHNA